MNTIRLRQGNDYDVKRAAGLIAACAKTAQTDLAVSVEPWEDSLTDPQRKIAFKLLTLLSERAVDNFGKPQSVEVWRSALLIRFGYIAEVAPGMAADGRWIDIAHPKSMADKARGKNRMSKAEMSDFYAQLEAYAAEKGVWLGEAA